jgi:hypothetical protein
MPRASKSRNLVAEQPEITAAITALEIAQAHTEAAEAGNNKFIQSQAKELLERVEADRAAKATDEPSGVELGVSYDFLKQDPTDFAPRLKRKEIEVRKDHRYRWINTSPRRMERRVNQGWLPVPGASVTNGDSILASMPEDRAAGMERQLVERREIAKTAHTRRLEAEGARLGMEVFTGNKSLREGLE